MTNEIKECPWCKTTAITPVYHAKDCFISLMDDFRESGKVPSRSDTIKAWNTRPSEWIIEADIPFNSQALLIGERFVIEYIDKKDYYLQFIVGKDEITKEISRYAKYNL